MSIRGVLFDKDGTLIDVNATWVPIYRHVLMDLLGVDQDGAEAMMAKAGYDRASGRFRAGSALAGGTTRQIAAIWWPDLEGDALDEKIHALDNDYTHLVRERLEPLMPLEPILAELRGMGLVLGVATNDSHVSAIAHMTHVGVVDHFEDIIAADTVPVPKPSGNMVRRFAEITGLPAASIAMVGDNHHDMEEARAGGAGLAIAVLSGNAAHEDIAHLADHTIASIAELPSLLRSL
ncbi:HAD family hydrolase [Aestuariivirga sp.]|jgi:phosphoglycolate phosphatase|uniref:HAD family hydrolase n=1 Tax=Aestuariivirga sp. TaxID=2650926 RepID=UPI00378390A4